jgi:hypothetical protein
VAPDNEPPYPGCALHEAMRDAPAGRQARQLPGAAQQAALAGLETESRQAIGEAIVLYREFPAWAVWLPYGGRPWIAVRPASGRAPGPDLPMIWAHAGTVAELADLTRSADAQLRPS